MACAKVWANFHFKVIKKYIKAFQQHVFAAEVLFPAFHLKNQLNN